MHIRIFLSHPCGFPGCYLTSILNALPAVGSVSDISDLDKEADQTEHGLILLVDGSAAAIDSVGRCRRALESLVKVSRNSAKVRLWPIVLVSQEASELAKGIRETPGAFDPGEEFWFETVTLRLKAEIKRPAELCGAPRGLSEALQHVFQRRILPHLALTHPNASMIRAWGNLKQCCMALRRGATKIHYDMHQASSGLKRADGQRGRDIVCSIAQQEFTHLLSPERIAEFMKPVPGQNQPGPVIDDDKMAIYLEEGAASLELAGRIPRPSDKRLVIFLADDQADVLAEIKGRLDQKPNLRIEAIACGPNSEIWSEMEAAVAKEVRNTSDLSGVAGKLVFDMIDRRLTEMNAAQLWLKDGWRFFVASDVRLHPRAPSGGLEVIRRVRDAFPYVSTIAVTVRRGLAYELQDEGADGYLWKGNDNGTTAEDLWSMIDRVVWSTGAYYVEPDLKLSRTDQFFWPLLERKYFLKAAELGDQRIRFACFRQRCDPALSLAILRQLPADAVVAILMAPDATPLEIWEQLRNWKDHPDRRIVMMKRSASGANGSGTEMCPSSVLHLDKVLRPEPQRRYDRRWTLLVPRSAHAGVLNVVVDDQEVERYRVMLSERFGGATTNDVAGVWLESARGVEIKDNNQRIEIFGRNTAGSYTFLRDLGQTILRELGQEEVLLTEDKVAVWSLRPESLPPLPEDVEKDGLLDLPFAVMAAEAAGL